MIDITQRFNKHKLKDFCNEIMQISNDIGFKVSSRGWGYIMEQRGFITKDQFDKVEDLINRCRKEGMLPVDFVAEEVSRKFDEIHEPSRESYPEFIASWLDAAMNCHNSFDPDWWEGEEYYIQVLVEKIDLVSLFQPLCREYHIAIGNAKGWSSISQRADYARRFRKAEKKGLKCVLLYCGDHDPDGLRISDTLRKNLDDIMNIRWTDGFDGYDPIDLEIKRFGLDYDFIIKNKLTWIDNLITGSGKNLADSNHPNYNLSYLVDYKKKIGIRKCEANAIVIVPELGRKLFEKTILSYLGKDAKSRFEKKKEKVRDDLWDMMDQIGVKGAIENAIERLDEM